MGVEETLDSTRTFTKFTRDELLDMSEWSPGQDVELGASYELTGIVVPSDIVAGEILSPDRARKLAAQLLLQAELYEQIWNTGYEQGVAIMEQQCATLRKALQQVRKSKKSPKE